jgi:insulysin
VNPNQANNAISYVLKYGSNRDPRLRVVSSLLSQILKEPAFDILRTKEQLGYIVSCIGQLLPNGNEHVLRLVIQSEKSASYCESRIEAFFETMTTRIEEMPDDIFQEHKATVQKRWREAHKNLGEESAVYNYQINVNHLDFMRSECSADIQWSES